MTTGKEVQQLHTLLPAVNNVKGPLGHSRGKAQGPDQGHPQHKAVESQSALLPAFLNSKSQLRIEQLHG